MLVNRRKLIQTIALGSAAVIIQACTKKSDEAPAIAGELAPNADAAVKALELVSESDATATALGYKHNASAVPAAEKTEKNGTKGDKQNCSNCAFYSALEGVEGGGKCQLITAGYVKSTGWCKSWSLKQG
jgi:hypothetical protein